MRRKLFFVLSIVLVSSHFSYSQNSHKLFKIVNNGDVYRSGNGPYIPYNGPPAYIDNSPLMGPFVNQTGNDLLSVVTMSELSTSARSTYDLQSHGVIHYIWMEPTNPINIHACFMTSTIPGTWDDRNTRYFFSSNSGATWNYRGTVGATRSGFPSLTATPDGRAVISMHNTDGGGIQRGQLYVDVVSGSGAFTRLDPGLSNPAIGNIWTMNAATNTKAIILGSQSGADSVKVNTTTSLNISSFLGWQSIKAPDGSPGGVADQYAAAIGTGKWGIAFIGKNNSVYLTESTNEGVSWSIPVTVRAYNQSDGTGSFRSIDIIYEGVNARVFFGVGHVDPFGGNYFPGMPSSQMFWGPDINGGVPITVDQAPGLNGTNPFEVFFSCCRGSIGKTTDGILLLAVYNKARADTNSEGNNYFDAYCTYSTNHGLTWGTPIQLTNLTGQGILADYRYVSISPNNPPSSATIVCARDTIPGSSIYGSAPSVMREMFIRIQPNLEGIHNISKDMPANYLLHQNYPNPFNPSTKIRFELPKSGFVSLKIYNVSGMEVMTIVNENVSAGIKEADFNASSIASGIYFYTIRAGDFYQTRKMVLLK